MDLPTPRRIVVFGDSSAEVIVETLQEINVDPLVEIVLGDSENVSRISFQFKNL